MKRRILFLALVLLALCGLTAVAQAEGYTEFCTLDAHFTWLESANVHTEPYASSSTTGKTVTAGDVVFIERLVKNEYGNLWAELFTGGYLCFYDKASEKVCASFVDFSNGAAPVTTSKVNAPEGEIAQGTSFTFSGILDSTDVCPIFLFDIWCGPAGGHSFDELIQSWPSGVTTQIDITDYNINELYDISTLPPGEYTYVIRVWMGFTYEGYMFSFGDKYVPVQKTFTIVEKPTSYTVPSGSLSTKLSYLRNVFPDGWHWNHWSESDLGSTYTMKSFTVNGNATTISTKPCDKSSSLHANVSNSTCNHYWGSWKGVQCTGFARMMFELVWDMDTETESYGMYYHPDTDNADVLDYVKPGDMVWTGGHMFLVTAVNGDDFTVVHCNRDSNCNIEWDYTYTKDWVHARMKGNGTGYVASPTPIVYGSDITNWAKYQVVTSSLNVRRWASTSVDKSCTLQEGDYFYVDLNHTITKSGNLYGYCRTADGKYGWVQYANTSYAVPVEEDCEHANADWVVIKLYSCTENGEEHLICPDCGELLATNTVPAIGHLAGQWENTHDATCTEYGERIQTCDWCGELLNTETIPPTDHPCDWRYTKEPTCTEEGVGEVYCTACGIVLETETTPAKGHTKGDWVTTQEPTCTEYGIDAKCCINCGVALEIVTIAATGHTEGEWVVITEATSTTTGLKRQSCTACGVTLNEEVIPATGSDLLSSITLSAGANLSAVPGGTVTVPVSINNPDAVALGSITLYYTLPEGVTVSSVTACGAAANASVQYDNTVIFASDINAGITGNGQVLTITFAVDEAAAFPLTFSLKPEIVAADLSADATPASISISIEEGSKRVPGDVNEDGKINSRDALAVVKYAAGQSVSINTANADVNADGKINSRDALTIIKYAAGQNVVLK